MRSKFILTLAAVLASMASAPAALYVEAFDNVNATIPDGNPVGITLRGNVNNVPEGWTIGQLAVGLQLSGGYNGNLYAYLVSPSGMLVQLMNQPGTGLNVFGAAGAGMNITLTDSSLRSLQSETSGAILSGSYQPLGSLSDFNGLSPNGTWTLYFADLTSGGGNSVVNGWSLEITAVPEPVNQALAWLACLLMLGVAVRRLAAAGFKRAQPLTDGTAEQSTEGG